MKILNFLKKTVTMPHPGVTVSVEVIKTFRVDWIAAKSKWGTDNEVQCEFFLNIDEAKMFEENLKKAFMLTKSGMYFIDSIFLRENK